MYSTTVLYPPIFGINRFTTMDRFDSTQLRMGASRMDLQSCCLLFVLLATVVLSVNRDKVQSPIIITKPYAVSKISSLPAHSKPCILFTLRTSLKAEFTQIVKILVPCASKLLCKERTSKSSPEYTTYTQIHIVEVSGPVGP